ncbi:hypothetical protein K438DRAFT_1997476 [Mycena galopus ATCC 62051]|nr:hypothetical protein K438DRAFT_1997476 [Mycena galopus ATCC 62051]
MVVEARALEEWHEERYGVQGRVVLGRRVVPLAKAAPRQHTLQLSLLAFLPEHGSTPARPRQNFLLAHAPTTPHPRADPYSESHPHPPSLEGATRAPPPAPAPAHFPPLSLTPCTRTRNHTCFPTPYCFIRRPILVRFAPHPHTSCSRLGLSPWLADSDSDSDPDSDAPRRFLYDSSPPTYIPIPPRRSL